MMNFSKVCQIFGLTSPGTKIIGDLNTAPRILLTGPSSCGKTSLLFECAINCAEHGETVLFIASKPISRLPLFVNGRDQPKSEILKLIRFIYLPNYEELIKFFSTVHINNVEGYGRPCHVIIDEFETYFQEKLSRTEATTRVAKCLAYVIDAVDYFSKMGSSNDDKQKCDLLIAETVPSNSSIDKDVLYKHWINSGIKINQTGPHTFEIKNNGHQTSTEDSLSTVAFQYEISETGIQLHQTQLIS